MKQQRFPSVTFVIRIWRENSIDETGQRGWIEHVASGESVAFLNLEQMLAFLISFGVAFPNFHHLSKGDER